ncbi:MAG TPA: AraC family transcriptional regulator [Polyangiaceae bacterium]|jgi:AraC-like DNA-binding protein|nr:AraC family transcriptional regulator [Polyangiaceae bacterium]
MTTDEHSLPAAHILYLVELVKRWHVPSDALLTDSGLDEKRLRDPRFRVGIGAVVQVLERARALTGEPALGLYLGLQMHVSAHGYLGYAALSASTMREALDLGIRFAPIVTTALSMRLRVDGREASLIVEEHADLGSARDIVLLSFLVGLWRAGETMTGRELVGHIDLAVPRIGTEERVAQLGPRVRCGQPATRLLFDSSMLSLPYRLADPVALQLAREQCERILGSIGLDGQIAARVSALFSNGKGGFLPLEKVATALHVSPRTLKRQLAAEGVSFSMLVEKERRERAMILLGSQSLSIKDVAERLGYSNVANFTRAFQRWTGKTPGEHRVTGVAPTVTRK